MQPSRKAEGDRPEVARGAEAELKGFRDSIADCPALPVGVALAHINIHIQKHLPQCSDDTRDGYGRLFGTSTALRLKTEDPYLRQVPILFPDFPYFLFESSFHQDAESNSGSSYS